MDDQGLLRSKATSQSNSGVFRNPPISTAVNRAVSRISAKVHRGVNKQPCHFSESQHVGVNC